MKHGFLMYITTVFTILFGVQTYQWLYRTDHGLWGFLLALPVIWLLGTLVLKAQAFYKLTSDLRDVLDSRPEQDRVVSYRCYVGPVTQN